MEASTPDERDTERVEPEGLSLSPAPPEGPPPRPDTLTSAELAALESITDSPPALRHLPVRVSAVLGHFTAPVGYWRNLQPHQRVILDRSRGPLLVTVNGRIVGTADYVVVQGQMGLKIRTWLKGEAE